MITDNARLIEQLKIVPLVVAVVPSSLTPAYVSLKGYERATIVVIGKNGTTVTGSAVTVKQAKNVAASGEKAVTLTKAWRALDLAAPTEDLTEFAVASNTFTPDATDSKQNMYAIEISPDDLDVDGGFDCIRLGLGNATAQTIIAFVILWGAKSRGLPLPAALTD